MNSYPYTVSHLFSATLLGSCLCTQNLQVNTNGKAAHHSVFQGLNADHANLLQPDIIKIGMETTKIFWEHCYRLIKKHEKLNSNFKLQLYTVNPKIISHFKKSYIDLPKNDSIDAWVITDRVRFGRVENSSSPETLYITLRQITRHKFNLSQLIKTEKARALNLVFLKFSDFTQSLHLVLLLKPLWLCWKTINLGK